MVLVVDHLVADRFGVSCFPSWGFMFSPSGLHVFPRRVSCFPSMDALRQRDPSMTKSLLTSRCPRIDMELSAQGPVEDAWQRMVLVVDHLVAATYGTRG